MADPSACGQREPSLPSCQIAGRWLEPAHAANQPDERQVSPGCTHWLPSPHKETRKSGVKGFQADMGLGNAREQACRLTVPQMVGMGVRGEGACPELCRRAVGNLSDGLPQEPFAVG